MKKQLYISGKMIGSIIFEVIGIVVLIFGIRSTKNFDNAAYVTSRADLNGRQFVRVIINEYMVKPKSEVNQEFSEGICVKYTSLFGTEYSTYNVKLDSGDYLRVQISDPDKNIALANYVKGAGDGVEVVARVMDLKEINYLWYNGVKDFDPNTLIADKTVRECGRGLYKNCIYIGVYLAAVALYGIISEALLARSFKRKEEE
ncbi:MAG: hypothetical protein J5829_10040 [Lachnospiraceae bacterium]|nr:hypothetical protein [Lachnospiraceae bacterium]